MKGNWARQLWQSPQEERCCQAEVDREMAEEAYRAGRILSVVIALMQGLMIGIFLFRKGGPFLSPRRSGYFLLYWLLLGATVLFYLLMKNARQESPRAQFRIQWIYCGILCGWACCITALDALGGSSLVVFSYILPTVAALGMLPPRGALGIFGGAWALVNLLLALTPYGQANLFSNLINSTFITFISVFVAGQLYFTRRAALCSNAQINRLAVTDQLTGLYNRRFMDMTLASLVSAAADKARLFVGLMIDIDYFKEFNDQFGHLAGDACLERIARLLKEQAQKDAGFFPVRYGGEEFFVCWLDCPASQAQRWAEAFCRQVAELRIPREGGADGQATVSIGLCAGTPGKKLYSLVRQADAALYVAKAKGRNQLFFAAQGEEAV